MYPPHTMEVRIKEVMLACGVAPMVVLIVITEAAGTIYCCEVLWLRWE